LGLFGELRSAIAQLAAATGGGARARVVSVGEAVPGESDRLAVTVVLELTGAWADHVQAPFDVLLSPEGAARLAPGLEVPVAIDGESGDLVGLDVADYERETRGGAPKPALAPAPVPAGMSASAATPVELDDDGLPKIDPADPVLAPIDGVSLEQCAAAMVGAGSVPPAVQQAWMGRAIGDWRVGARLGAAAQAARKAES
jgi:hypothetical protein